jgi:HAD superfamily hydrolase (TIGR01484 family)
LCKKEMQLPIVCFDLDGTLVDAEGNIHPNDIALLELAEPPVCFIPATGRSLGSVRRTFARNGLFMNSALPFPLVLQNGALLYAAGEKRLEYFPFDESIQDDLIQLALDSANMTFLFLAEDEIHLLWEHRFGLEAARRYDFATQPFTPQSRLQKFSKVMGISQSPEALEDFAVRANALPVHGAYSMAEIYEINPRHVNKGRGLKILLAELGWQDRPVFTAGDGENDEELLTQAFRSFVPMTAPVNIQNLASFQVDIKKTGLLEPMIFAATQISFS